MRRASPGDRAELRRLGAVPVASVQGTLALDLRPRLDPPDSASDAARLRRPGGGDVVSIEEPVRRRVEQWAQRFAQAAVEIASGDRPASQLVRWTSPTVQADLARRAQLVARAAGRPPGQGRPLQAVRPQVMGVHICFVERDICEVSIRVRYGKRHRAVAARFEARDGQLVCTALEFA